MGAKKKKQNKTKASSSKHSGSTFDARKKKTDNGNNGYKGNKAAEHGPKPLVDGLSVAGDKENKAAEHEAVPNAANLDINNTYSFLNPYTFISLNEKSPQRTKITGRFQEPESAKAEGENNKRYTGVIRYSVLTKTPLFIPDTEVVSQHETEPDHKVMKFFSYRNARLDEPNSSGVYDQILEKNNPYNMAYKPVIPGSEIRGMFRSNYEILTNSCLSSLETKRELSKRTKTLFKPGLLKKSKGKYSLYEAEDHLLRTKTENNYTDINHPTDETLFNVKSYRQKDLPEGVRVYFNKEARNPGKPLITNVKIAKGYTGDRKECPCEGYVIKGEDGPAQFMKKGEDGSVQPDYLKEKHNCHIFECKDKKNSKVAVFSSINDEIPAEIEELRSVLKLYEQNKDSNPLMKHSGYKYYRMNLESIIQSVSNNTFYFPVYYRVVTDGGNNKIYLSPACFTREVYYHTVKDLVGEHTPCGNKDELCPACRMFGTLGEEFAVSGRLRFSDLQYSGKGDNETVYGSKIRLAPLSEPKLSNMQFYLKRPSKDAFFWTADYYMDKDGKAKIQVSKINGRKVYWHNLNYQTNMEAGQNSKNEEDEKDRLNLSSTITPVNPGVKFNGEIYFEDLSDAELNLLCYLVDALQTDMDLEKKEYGFKLGKAKPLGLGSIATKVDEVKIREFGPEEGNQGISRKMENFERNSNSLTGSAADSEHTTKHIVGAMHLVNRFDTVNHQNIDYPRTKEGGDIFEWFSEVGYKSYRIRNGQKEIVNFPNDTTKEFFQYYLKSIETDSENNTNNIDLGKIIL